MVLKDKTSARHKPNRRYPKSARSLLGERFGIVGHRTGVNTNEPVLATTSNRVLNNKTGKRFFHFVVLVFVSVMITIILPVRVIPIALHPLWIVPTNQDSGFPRKFLATEVRDLPILGGEQPTAFSRIVRIVRQEEKASLGGLPATRVGLVDPFTNEMYRSATENEKRIIGDSAYALEHFGQPADRQLMLTFDDGAGMRFTTQMLDILAREGVHATFFSTGSNIVQHPDVFKRIVGEGHMAGNRTMYHIDFDEHTDIRNRAEIIATDRVMRATAGYASRLFRIPTADPDNHILALLQAQQLGYLEVDNQIDTDDWRVAPGKDIAVPQLDGRGRVVLVHESGDGSATVDMLEKLIAEAKLQGYTFTTLAPLLPAQYIPAKSVAPSRADLATYHTLEFAEMAPGVLRGFLFWLGIGSLTIRAMLFRPKYGVLGMAAHPYAAGSRLVPLLFIPLITVAAGRSLAEGNWRSIALFAALVVILHMIISITAVAIPRERSWHRLVALSMGGSKRSSSHRTATAGGGSTPWTARRGSGPWAAPTNPHRVCVAPVKWPARPARSDAQIGPTTKTAIIMLLLAIVVFVFAFKVVSLQNVKGEPFWAAYGLVITAFIFARFGLAGLYRPSPHDAGDYWPTVAIIVPAYNEPDIATTLLHCLTVGYPKDLLRVVVVDDKSTDTTLSRINAVAAKYPELVVIPHNVNGGKRQAMATGMAAAGNVELYVFIDSDSQVTPAAVRTIATYFADPTVGAVCGHTDVANLSHNILTRMQAMQYYIAFRIYKSAEALFGSVTCCSGCFSAYRRSAVRPVARAWLNQKFLGKPSTFGDDRSLTNYLLRNWRVLYAPDAQAYTNVPEHLKQFLRQQLRWKKSWLREAPRAMRAVLHKNPVMVLMFGLSIVLPLIAPQVVLRAFVVQPYFISELPFWYFGGVATIALIYGLFYRLHKPVRRWYHGIFFTLFYTIVLVLQMPYAMATIRDSKWGTR
jgi:hyaluronan synthase